MNNNDKLYKRFCFDNDYILFKNVKPISCLSNPLMVKLNDLSNKFWNSYLYYFFVEIVAMTSMYFENSVLGIGILAVFIALMLLFCDDIMSVLLPALNIMLMASEHYDNIYNYVPLKGIAVILIICFIVHCVLYIKPIALGRTFPGLVLVAIAATFGGLGSISKKEFLSPSSLYECFSIGIGMLIVYLLIKSNMTREGIFTPLKRLVRIFYIIGMFSGFLVLLYYYKHTDFFKGDIGTVFISYRNYLASVLLICMPIPCYYALRHDGHFFSVLFMYLCLLLTASRSGMVFGTMTLVACVLYLLKYNHKKRRIYLILLAICAVPAAFLAVELIGVLFESRVINGDLFYFQSSRIEFYKRAIIDFFSNPLFGVGLGSQKNADVFGFVPGSIIYYQNYFFQICASMGFVGIFSYAILLYERFAVIGQRFSARTAVFIIGFAGIFLMSMTNPGEFVPFPNEMMAVISFAVIEGEPMVIRDPSTGRRLEKEEIIMEYKKK